MTGNISELKAFQVIATRGIVLNRDNHILVVSTNQKKWHLPGGWIDNLENPYTACEREVYEETGLIVKTEKIIFISEMIEDSISKHGNVVQKFDLYCVTAVQGSDELDEKWQDPDNNLIQYKKFVNEEEWRLSKDIYAPKPLKNIKPIELTTMPNIYYRLPSFVTLDD